MDDTRYQVNGSPPSLADVLEQARAAGYPAQALDELHSQAAFLRRVERMAKM
ncbi:hypothetical protein MQE22_08645 [Acidithiobacillus sp. YTS05]|nr:hypothetical protein MQE22_08645 [Acidithiobacillus sp. YTS05]